MSDVRPRDYRHSALWRSIGWTMVAAVVILSLVPHLPQPPSFLGWDKSQHFLAYAVLTFWFCLSYSRRWRWPAFFLALGALMEILQGLTGARSTDLFDMVANGIGVAIGWVLAFTPLASALQILEDALTRQRGSNPPD